MPALSSCYWQGETIDELVDNVREAIGGVFEVLKEQGGQPETNIRILDSPSKTDYGPDIPGTRVTGLLPRTTRPLSLLNRN